MTKEDFRVDFLGKIKSRISKHGFHVTVVQGGPLPWFAYTIGLHEKVGFELVLAGASFLDFDELLMVVKGAARRILAGERFESQPFEIEGVGSMSLQDVEPSWGNRLLLGALDYYGLRRVKAFQISPDRKHWTIDIPNMKEPWDSVGQAIWKWLEVTWDFPVSSQSRAITNLDALRGGTVTEVVRWEESEWELFAGAGPDVPEGDLRIVPLGTMLGHDPTLECIVGLEVGSGLWRDDASHAWHPWGEPETPSGADEQT